MLSVGQRGGAQACAQGRSGKGGQGAPAAALGACRGDCLGWEGRPALAVCGVRFVGAGWIWRFPGSGSVITTCAVLSSSADTSII